MRCYLVEYDEEIGLFRSNLLAGWGGVQLFARPLSRMPDASPSALFDLASPAPSLNLTVFLEWSVKFLYNIP